ncbi:MAG: hypothetical protein ACE5I3_11005 [Phycisphaerae bacterium]
MRRWIRMLVPFALCLQVGGCVISVSSGDGGPATFAGAGSGVLPAIPPVGGASLIQTVPGGGFFGGSGFTIGGTFGGGFTAVGAQQGSINLTSP